METPFQAPNDLEKSGPEVRSYVYQTILEFEPYTTTNTTVTVVARDPLKLLAEEGFEDRDPSVLKTLWRIAIVLNEDETQLEEEALHEDVYVAIKLAKDKMLKTLSDIQDHVVSNQDRMMQINSALAGSQLH